MRHRGIVVEIAPKNKVIIMTPSGEFLKVPLRKHVQVGQEIRYTPRRERLSVWQLAAAAVLFLALVGSWPMISERLVPPQPAVPAFTITLDVDSSVELLVSADRKVVGVEGLNRSGRDLVMDLDVVGADLTAALKTIAARTGGREAVVTVAALEGSAAAITEKGEGMYTELERGGTGCPAGSAAGSGAHLGSALFPSRPKPNWRASRFRQVSGHPEAHRALLCLCASRPD